jgi:hypothetical protein
MQIAEYASNQERGAQTSFDSLKSKFSTVKNKIKNLIETFYFFDPF